MRKTHRYYKLAKFTIAKSCLYSMYLTTAHVGSYIATIWLFFVKIIEYSKEHG